MAKFLSYQRDMLTVNPPTSFISSKMSRATFYFSSHFRATDDIALETYVTVARSVGIHLYAVGIRNYNLTQLQVSNHI